MALVKQPLDERLRQARSQRLWVEGAHTQTVDIRGPALHALLPHRAPFLLIDSITQVDLPQAALCATRRIDPADPILAGHFPGRPVYPGVLLIEALAQLATCFRPLEVGGPWDNVFMAGVRAAFLRPVYPGDELTLLGLRLGPWDGLFERGVGQVLRGDEICAVAAIEGCHVEP